jgi:hypothetical protein
MVEFHRPVYLVKAANRWTSAPNCSLQQQLSKRQDRSLTCLFGHLVSLPLHNSLSCLRLWQQSFTSKVRTRSGPNLDSDRFYILRHDTDANYTYVLHWAIHISVKRYQKRYGSIAEYLALTYDLKYIQFYTILLSVCRYIYIYIYIYTLVNWRDFIQYTGWGGGTGIVRKFWVYHPGLLTYKVACSPPPIKVILQLLVNVSVLSSKLFYPLFGFMSRSS